jgi:hypothetical protein
MSSFWTSIWTRPRATIAQIVATNPNQHLWLLASIYGFQGLLNAFQSFLLGNSWGLIPIFLVAIVLSPFWGYISFAVWSWLVMWTGRLFKGGGTFQQIRAAYAWSCVPMIINIPLWILLAAIFGSSLFANYGGAGSMGGGLVTLLYLVILVRLVIAIWSIVIYLNALAEVQKFSILRSIGNALVAALVVAVLYFLLFSALAYVWSGSADLSLSPAPSTLKENP